MPRGDLYQTPLPSSPFFFLLLPFSTQRPPSLGRGSTHPYYFFIPSPLLPRLPAHVRKRPSEMQDGGAGWHVSVEFIEIGVNPPVPFPRINTACSVAGLVTHFFSYVKSPLSPRSPQGTPHPHPVAYAACSFGRSHSKKVFANTTWQGRHKNVAPLL